MLWARYAHGDNAQTPLVKKTELKISEAPARGVMGKRDVCIGVDGGGTKTHAIVICASGGAVLGQATVGSSNKNSVGEEAAAKAFCQAVSAALVSSGHAHKDIVSLAAGMSGCDTEADVVLWRSICKRVAPAARHLVENDSVMALCSGTGGPLEGIVVISGTGSIALGVAPDKPRVRVGGWGPKLGDAGNGCAIGQVMPHSLELILGPSFWFLDSEPCALSDSSRQAALNAVIFAADGRGPSTPLTRLVLQHCGVASEEDLLALSYGDGSGSPARFASWDEVAALAPLVMAAEREGCAVAAAILRDAAAAICLLAETAAARLYERSGDGVVTALAPISGTTCTVVLSG